MERVNRPSQDREGPAGSVRPQPVDGGDLLAGEAAVQRRAPLQRNPQPHLLWEGDCRPSELGGPAADRIVLFRESPRSNSPLPGVIWHERVPHTQPGLPLSQVYFIAWSSRFGVGGLVLATLALLVLHPPARAALFPLRPLSLAPGVGIPGVRLTTSLDPEGLTPGQREELDASQFTQEVADLASAPFEADDEDPTVREVLTEAATTGLHGEPGEEGAVEGEPVNATAEDATAKNAKKKKTKVLKKHGLPIQIITGELADAWERWANVLEPTTPPFEAHRPRVKVALHILPFVLAFLLLPAAFLMYTYTFLLGFLFFGDPILQRIPTVLDALAGGDWREATQIR